MRTLDEAQARARAVQDGFDPLGFRREVLLAYLPAERLREFVKPGADLSGWEPEPLTREQVLSELAEYLEFAWGKARDHRGISASRSVDKVGEWLWLLGDDELVRRYEAARYGPYGAPKLLVACEALGLPVPELPTVQRMARGLPCRDDCLDGCGS